MGRAKIGAVISLDGEKEYKQAVKSVEQETKNLRAESQMLKEQFRGQESSMEALRARHDLLRRTLDVHQKKVDEVSNGLNHAREVYGKAGEKLGELEDIYKQARERMEEMEGSADTTSEALEEQRKEVERLAGNLEKSRDKYRLAGERVTNWETQLNQARTALYRTNNELRENEDALEAAGEGARACADGMEELAQEADGAADSASEIGNVFAGSLAASAVEAVTEKVAELAQAAAETTKEMEAAQQQVVASTGAAAAEAGKYGEIMKELYRNNYGENFEDLGEAIGIIKRNLGDLSSEQLKNVAEDAITLRDTFGMDYQEQIRAVKMLMDSFGISSKEAYSLIAQGAQGGLNKNEDLLDTINEYSVHYKNMGVSAEGFFNSLANGTSAGTFSVDKLGDAYKEFGIRVKDTAQSTTEGFELLGLDAENMREKFAAGGAAAQAATEETLQALFAMDDQVAQNQAGVDLFGTMWEDLGIDGVKALTDVNGQMSATKNSMESIKEVKYADIGSEIAGIAREIELKLMEPLEKNWLPGIRDGLGFVADNIEIISVGMVGLAGAATIWKLSQTAAGAEVIKVLKMLIFTRAADTSATVAQTAAQGAHTIATKVATMAQTAFNTVMAMNPIAQVLLALAGAAVAYKAFSKAVEKATEEMINADEPLRKSRESVEELGDEVDELKNSTEEAKKARESSIEGIEAEYNAYDELAGKLINLAEKESLTNGEKQLMKTYIDQLNEAMPELNLSIDENTGKLNKNGESIKEIIEANKERLIVEAQQSMLGEILQEQMRAEIAVAKAQNERDSVVKKLKASEELLVSTEQKCQKEIMNYGTVSEGTAQQQEELRVRVMEYRDQLEALDSQISDAQHTSEEAKNEYDEVADAVANVAEQNGIMGESAEENSGASAMAAREAAEAYKEMEDGIRSSLEGVASIFDEFNAGQEISTEEMLENLESQEQGMEQWRDNLKILAGAAGEGMTDEFFQYLVQMGPQGANAVAELSEAFQNGEPEFREICDKYKNVLMMQDSTAGEITDSYYDTGLNAAKGMAKGIQDGTKEVADSAGKMANLTLEITKKTLKINSPSKVMRLEVGQMIPKGVSIGIKDGTREVEKSAEEMAKAAHKKAKTILQKSMEKKGNFGISGKNKEGAAKSNAAYSKEVLEAGTKWFSEYKKQHDTTLKSEVVFWENIRKQLKKGTAAYREATKSLRDAKKKYQEDKQDKKEAKTAAKKTASQEKLSASGQVLEQYKVYYKVSAKAEADYWNIVRKQFKKGTNERIEADQKYYEAKQNLNEQLKTLNEEYVQNSKDVQAKLKEDIKILTDAYKDAVKERADTIYSSFGLFDQFQSESESGAALLHNLKTQVAGIADWELQLEKLAGRGLPTELLDELKEMGPQASAALHSLNTLTDEQLKEYAALWQQKKDLSQSQAVKDMEPMRKQTEKEIEQLKETAQKSLDKLKETYEKAIAGLNKGITNSLKKIANSTKKTGEDATAKLVSGIKSGVGKKSNKVKLKEARDTISKDLGKLPAAGKEIGKNTLEGILAGLEDKKAMQKSAKRFIEELKKEMQKAAEIHSPSRLFKREIGLQLPAGVGEGIEEGAKTAKKKGRDMVKALLDACREQRRVQEISILENRQYMNALGNVQAVNNLTSTPVQQYTNVKVDNGNAAMVMGEILAMMQKYIPQMAEKQIVMDTGKAVGALSGSMSAEFAMMGRRLKR